MKKCILLVVFLSMGLASGAQSLCDSVSNLVPEATYIIYRYASAWGYMAGTNENDFGEWADKFTGTGGGTVDSVRFLPARAYAATPTGHFSVIFYEVTATGPGTVIYTEDILITGLIENQWNSVALAAPLNVPSDFFLGIKVYATAPLDTFALLCNSTRPANTLWFHFNPGGFDMGWKENGEFTGGQMVTSMGIGVNLCVPASAENNDPDLDNNQISISPNPSRDVLNITANEEITGYAIYNLMGMKLQESEATFTDLNIDISDLAPGMYIINLCTPDSQKPLRFLKTE